MGDGQPYKPPWAATPLRARVTLSILLFLLLIQIVGIVSDPVFGGGTQDEESALGPTPAHRQKGPAPTTHKRYTAPPVAVSEGNKCDCSTHCIEHECYTDQDFDIMHSELIPARFSRCTRCAASSGVCTALLNSEPCSPAITALKEKVQQCNSHKTLGRGFTLIRDDQSRLLVPCAADRVEQNCRRKDRESALEFVVAKNAVKFVVENSQVDGPVQFVDFGVPDPLLDARVQTMASTDTSGKLPAPAVFVFGMKSPAKQFVSLVECLNVDTKAREKTLPMQLFEGNSFDPEVNNVMRILGTEYIGRVIRLRAPGYEEAMLKVFHTILKSESTSLVITHTPAGEQTKLLGDWMLKSNFIGFQPARCIEINGADSYTRLPAQDRHNSVENTLVWVKSTAQNAFSPICQSACVRTQCIEGWRTQYAPCRPDDLCVMTQGHGCSWEVAGAACSQDVNWKSVTDCAAPHLPVPTFSMCFSMDILLACRGVNGCYGVNTKRGTKALRMLNRAARDLNTDERGKPTMQIVDIGSFVGSVPLLFSKTYGGAIYMIEAVPTYRQLLSISKCFHGTANVRIEEWGAGEVEEVCSVTPMTSTENAGITTISCPSDKKKVAVAADGDVRTFKQNFRPLDSLLEQLKAAASLQTPRDYEPVSHPFVFLIDVNDRTASVLRGAKKWLSDSQWKPKHILMAIDAVSTDSADEDMEEDAIYQILSSNGYSGSVTSELNVVQQRIDSGADIKDLRLASRDHLFVFTS